MSSILPEYIELASDSEESVASTEYPDTTWILNEETKRIGGLSDDREECVAQAAKIALRTEKQQYEIYPIWYGSTLYEKYGDTKPHVYAEVEYSIKQCLAQDKRIESVGNFTFGDDNGNVIVNFDIGVSEEEIAMETEVNING